MRGAQARLNKEMLLQNLHIERLNLQEVWINANSPRACVPNLSVKCAVEFKSLFFKLVKEKKSWGEAFKCPSIIHN